MAIVNVACLKMVLTWVYILHLQGKYGNISGTTFYFFGVSQLKRFYFPLAEILRFLTLSSRLPRWNTASLKTSQTVAIRFSVVRIYSAELGTSYSSVRRVIGAAAYPRAEGPRTSGVFSLSEGPCQVCGISASCMDNPSLSLALWANRKKCLADMFRMLSWQSFPIISLPALRSWQTGAAPWADGLATLVKGNL